MKGCIFSGNMAGDVYPEGGGGMSVLWGESTLIGCIFSGNSTALDGGGIASNGSPDFFTCIFSGNSAGRYGGGMYSTNSLSTVAGCTFAGNSAGIDAGAIFNSSSSFRTVTNCIIWGNEAPANPAFHRYGPWPQVVFSNIQGGHTGDGTRIIDEDPLFVSPPTDTGPWDTVTWDATAMQTELHDSGATWTPEALVGLFVQPDDADPRWFPIVANTADTIRVWGNVTDFVSDTDTYLLHDLHLSSSSPCIDAAFGCSTPGGCDLGGGITVPETPATDIEGNARHDAGLTETNGGAGTPDYVDMGAYEYHP